jgi:hypothetical protein
MNGKSTSQTTTVPFNYSGHNRPVFKSGNYHKRRSIGVELMSTETQLAITRNRDIKDIRYVLQLPVNVTENEADTHITFYSKHR